MNVATVLRYCDLKIPNSVWNEILRKLLEMLRRRLILYHSHFDLQTQRTASRVRQHTLPQKSIHILKGKEND